MNAKLLQVCSTRRLFRVAVNAVIVVGVVSITYVFSSFFPLPSVVWNQMVHDLITGPLANSDSMAESTDSTSVVVYRGRVWGNYEPRPSSRRPLPLRPGDFGRPVELSTTDHTHVHTEFGMSMTVSDQLPMDRIVPDLRYFECKYWHYPHHLPTASVVIAFHNEGFSALMRTVHSVLLHSPQRLLREVLLVDDRSDKPHLTRPLDHYIDAHFGPFRSEWPHSDDSSRSSFGETLRMRSGKVRLLRNHERLGLIGTRNRGAKHALGQVVVFLDGHCEVAVNWLVPLLAPIAAHNRTVTVPIVDSIHSTTFAYRSVYDTGRHFAGIWEWGLLYKEIAIDLAQHMRTRRFSEPYESPAHAGGLLAIDRRYFLELGAYDAGLLLWGGENFELSFKVWQCGGGRLLWVPCSRVGHVYRSHVPYTGGELTHKRRGPLVMTNYKRVVEVWFDAPYKRYFYTRQPMAERYDMGDVSAQLRRKTELGCKSFDWFMKGVGSVVLRDFPRLPPNVVWGEVRRRQSSLCLDVGTNPQPSVKVQLYRCHGQGGNQVFRLNTAGQFGFGERCVDTWRGGQVTLHRCALGSVDGPWRYENETMRLLHRNQLCLTADSDVESNQVRLMACDVTLGTRQQWLWTPVNGTVPS